MEKSFTPFSGYLFLLIFFVLLALGIVGIVNVWHPAIPGLALITALLMSAGFFFINPNSSRVITLFGKYKGTTKENGFFWANPFFTKKGISLRARNFESERVKVNDKRGNPILISVITVWRVRDAYKAAFEVDDYASFVKLQSDAAVRSLVGQYSYDNFDDHQTEITLRSGLQEINHALEDALSERLAIAGIEVMESRIGYLAYAEEIASAMLKRQQAEAIVAARHKIVEGAVSMVEMALNDLSGKNIVHFDDDKKATMVSNLMVVLCSDKEVTPVVNTGTLYQ
ncbi:MAG: SPFH domain-containing protein [Saprospiraceae bacterium]|nr:SPFH domain-containing protein [Candidatus Opimibacter skivensis]MBL0009678.1 SPFH domain-containing protein [Candidatus Opimibacter skivensis]MBP6681312.1 SPFH domain-containing protein [Saprospiraceae bacterium]MBP8087094.1 SPFH domain-containing protein [Saprospiraceae bacterium]